MHCNNNNKDSQLMAIKFNKYVVHEGANLRNANELKILYLRNAENRKERGRTKTSRLNTVEYYEYATH